MSQLKYQNDYVDCTLTYTGAHINFDSAMWHALLNAEHALHAVIPVVQIHLTQLGPGYFEYLVKFVDRPQWKQTWDTTTNHDDPLLTVNASTGLFRQTEIALIQNIRAKLLRLDSEHQLTSVLCKY